VVVLEHQHPNHNLDQEALGEIRVFNHQEVIVGKVK
jgi:hypothetical protein